MSLMKNASYEEKSVNKLPEGASIVRKKVSVNVREIENGFIIDKSYDIDYTLNGQKDYMYYTKSWYSKENPLQINLKDEDEELSLADKL